MILSEEQIEKTRAERSKCPICGSIDVEYQGSDIDGENIYYYCECLKCGATFEETYELNFVGHANIKDDDNKIDFISA